MTSTAKVNTLDHVAIMVSDLERSFRFYHEVLGLEKVSFYEENNIAGASAVHALEDVHLKLYIMAAPGNPEITLHLSQITTPPSPTGRHEAIHHVPSAHICFTVTDIAAIHERLKEAGVELVSPPVAWPADQGGWTLCFLYDPDGNLVELVEPAADNTAN